MVSNLPNTATKQNIPDNTWFNTPFLNKLIIEKFIQIIFMVNQSQRKACS